MTANRILPYTGPTKVPQARAITARALVLLIFAIPQTQDLRLSFYHLNRSVMAPGSTR